MSRYVIALQAARAMADNLQAEYNRKAGYGATGMRGQLGHMSPVDCLHELQNERLGILRLRRKLAALDDGVDIEFSRVCEELGIPFTPGETRGKN
jgi:hypothetical protein